MSVLKFKDPATNEWKEITTIMGPAGPQGPQGIQGPKGEGADIVRLTNVDVPTQEQWEKMVENYNAQALIHQMTVNNQPVLSLYTSGTLQLGGILILFTTSPARDYNNAMDYYFDLTGYWFPMQSSKGPQKCAYFGKTYLDARSISLSTVETPGSKRNLYDALNYLDTNKIGSDALVASGVSYDNTESQIEVTTVQGAIDHLFTNAIDATYVENLGYQTEAQVNTLITTALGNIGVAEEGAY